jgi:hypothetical protein
VNSSLTLEEGGVFLERMERRRHMRVLGRGMRILGLDSEVSDTGIERGTFRKPEQSNDAKGSDGDFT